MKKVVFRFTLVLVVFLTCRAAQAATRTWTGSVSGYWTNAANWQGSLSPTNGDQVVFPDSATRKTVTNTLDNLSFSTLTFSGSNYVLRGLGDIFMYVTTGIYSHAPGTNLVDHKLFFINGTVMSNSMAGSYLSVKSHLGNGTNNTQIALGHTFQGAGNHTLDGFRSFSDPFQTMTKQGAGTLFFTSTAAGYQGTFNVTEGRLQLENAIFSAAVMNVSSNATVAGDGTISTLYNLGGGIVEPGRGGGLDINTEIVLSAASFLRIPFGMNADVTAGKVNLNGQLTSAHNFVGLELFATDPLVGFSNQTFKIINDTSSTLNSIPRIFVSVPEGGYVGGVGQVFKVNYQSGNGSNDLILTHQTSAPTPAATRTWSGITSGNGNWRTATNWSGAIAPTNTDNLAFPAVATGRSLTNDFIGAPVFGELRFGAPNYVIRGQPFSLFGGLTVSNSAAARFRTRAELAADQTFRNDDTLIFFNGLDTWEHTLTLLGSGQTEIQGDLRGGFGGIIEKNGTGNLILTGTNTYPGKINLTRGLTVSDATFPSSGGVSRFSVITNGTLQLTGGNIPGLTGDSGTVLLNAPVDSTGNVKLTNTLVRWDLAANPGLTVNGALALSGATLELTNSGVAITPFSAFTNILCLGTRTGTFAGLPDNSVITYDTNRFLLRYTGTGSNSIVLTALDGVTNYTWDGGGASGSWLNRTNWVGDVNISPDAILNFPVGAARIINTNGSVPVTTLYRALNYTGSNYVSYGLPVILSGGVTNSALGGTNTIAFDLLAGAPLTFNTPAATMRFTSNIDVQDISLEIRGNGRTIFDGKLLGTGTFSKFSSGVLTLNADQIFSYEFSGQINVEAGTLEAMGNFKLGTTKIKSGGKVTGTGSLRDVIVKSGGRLEPGTNGVGKFTAQGLTLEPGGTLALNVYPNNVASNNHLTCQLNYPVDLGGGALELNFIGAPLSGNTMTLIDTENGSQITGEFAGLPNGALIPYSNALMQITYATDAVKLKNLVVNPSTTYVWTGLGSPVSSWTVNSNWVTDTGIVSSRPAGGNTIVFPATATSRTITNTGSESHTQFRFGAPNYEIYAPQFALSDGIIVSNSAGARFHAPIILVSNQTFQVADFLRLYEPLNLYTRTLTVSGLGETRFDGAVSGTGSIMKNGNGSLRLAEANVTSFTANSGTLELANLTASSPLPLVTTGDISLAASATLLARVGYANPAARAPLKAGGNFNPGGATLSFVLSYTPTNGDVVILATSTSAITNTFAGLPEGAIFASGGVNWQISYAANSGKRVTLTAQSAGPTPPTFTSVSKLGNGNIRLQGAGATNVPIVIEATTNLADWSDIITRNMSGGTFQFDDTNAPVIHHRSYRARIQ